MVQFFGLIYAVLASLGPAILDGYGIAGLFRLHALWLVACAVALWRLMPQYVRPAVMPGNGGLLAQHLEIYASPFVAAPAPGFVCHPMTYAAGLKLWG